MLVQPTEQHYLQVKSWFNNDSDIYTWGGPKMTYPMHDKDFLLLLTADHLHSFSLLDERSTLVAFGQYYRRLGLHHLGRLAVNPLNRGQGWSKVLIKQLLKKAYSEQPAKGASLFVFKDNLIALECCKSLGFKETNYPDSPFPGNMQNCVYMVLDLSDSD